jgi:hypothetical protein
MCMHVLNGRKWRCPAVCCDIGALTSVSDSIVYTEFMPFGILLDINHTC